MISADVKFFWTLTKNLTLPKRTFAQQCSRGNKTNWRFASKKLVFELSVFNKYGLYSHDVINYADPVVCEALRRLPKNMLDARNFRIIRAMQLDLLKIYLPREKWVTYEQDLAYRYLGPYIEEIKAEWAEIHEFGCLNYEDTDWPANECEIIVDHFRLVHGVRCHQSFTKKLPAPLDTGVKLHRY